MNRRGFTLIELLVVIVLIGIIAVLITPGILRNVEETKQTSYNTLIKNIVISSQMYYEECEYGDLSDSKYGVYACNISSNTIETTLGTLANTGFLKVNDIKEVSGNEMKIVLNPRNNNDISDCKIKIMKLTTIDTDINNIENYKVTYKIKNIDTLDICPITYEWE